MQKLFISAVILRAVRCDIAYETGWVSGNGIFQTGIYYQGLHNPFFFHGINWFGMEEADAVLDGLYARSLSSHLHAISLEEGFNLIRIPLSLRNVINGTYDVVPSESCYSACQECIGKTPFEILDTIFEWCDSGKYPVRILLDMHRLENYRTDPLWYSNHFNESVVMEGWKILLMRYARYSSLVGIDLYNEPHDPATFDSGNITTDWRLYCQRWVREMFPFLIAHRQPLPLVFINGIKWGQDMRDFTEDAVHDWFSPEEKRKIVLSPHSYGPTLTATKELSYQYLSYRWDLYYGFLASNWTIVIGEWGGSQYNPDDVTWMNVHVEYLFRHVFPIQKQNLRSMRTNYSFSGECFWAWNPTSKDVHGYLEDDWMTPVLLKKKLLSKLRRDLIGSDSF